MLSVAACGGEEGSANPPDRDAPCRRLPRRCRSGSPRPGRSSLSATSSSRSRRSGWRCARIPTASTQWRARRLLRSHERFDLSRRYYEAALAIAPGDPTLLTAFAASLDAQGRAAEAASVRQEIKQRLALAAETRVPPPARARVAPITAHSPHPVPSQSRPSHQPASGFGGALFRLPPSAACPQGPYRLQSSPSRCACSGRAPCLSRRLRRATPVAPARVGQAPVASCAGRTGAALHAQLAGSVVVDRSRAAARRGAEAGRRMPAIGAP